MAVRVILSDSEDEENIPVRAIRPFKANRVLSDDDTDEESVVNVSLQDHVKPKELDETSPLQVNHKRAPRQRVIVSDDEEDNSLPSSSSNDSDSSSVYSEPEGDYDDPYSPVHINQRRPPKKRVVDLDRGTGNQDEADSAKAFIPSSLPKEATSKIGNDETVRKETLEKDKENKSPAPQPPSAPEKPSLMVPQIAPVVRPLVQPLKVPPTVAAKAPSGPMNETFSVAHTRPALLKQLEYVKVTFSY